MVHAIHTALSARGLLMCSAMDARICKRIHAENNAALQQQACVAIVLVRACAEIDMRWLTPGISAILCGEIDWDIHDQL
jgi:hypothetical protein